MKRFLKLCNVQVCDEEIEDDFSPEDTGPTYFAGPWTGCSVICGDGIKTREVTKFRSTKRRSRKYPYHRHQVTCYKKTEEGGIEVLEEGECTGKKPELEEPCSNDNPCEAADWIVSGLKQLLLECLN